MQRSVLDETRQKITAKLVRESIRYFFDPKLTAKKGLRNELGNYFRDNSSQVRKKTEQTQRNTLKISRLGSHPLLLCGVPILLENKREEVPPHKELGLSKVYAWGAPSIIHVCEVAGLLEAPKPRKNQSRRKIGQK